MNKTPLSEIKAKLASRQQGPTQPVPEPQPTYQVKPAAGKKDNSPPAERWYFACGHYVTKAGVAHDSCRKCINTARKAESAEVRVAKDLARGARRADNRSAPRLPDKSEFYVWYDAKTETWSGTLTVSMCADGGIVFDGEASGVFKLLQQLDAQYRASLKEAGDGQAEGA